MSLSIDGCKSNKNCRDTSEKAEKIIDDRKKKRETDLSGLSEFPF